MLVSANADVAVQVLIEVPFFGAVLIVMDPVWNWPSSNPAQQKKKIYFAENLVVRFRDHVLCVKEVVTHFM